MNIKQLMIKGFKITKQQVPSYADEEKWYEACDKAIKLIEQLKEPDEAKMNTKELERANILVENIKFLETLSKSEIEYLNVKYPNGRCDSIFMKDELKERIQKTFEDYADELKVELKDLGVDYE